MSVPATKQTIKMKRLRIVILVCKTLFVVVSGCLADVTSVVTIAQISDTHLGEKHSPQAADSLRKVVPPVARIFALN